MPSNEFTISPGDPSIGLIRLAHGYVTRIVTLTVEARPYFIGRYAALEDAEAAATAARGEFMPYSTR